MMNTMLKRTVKMALAVTFVMSTLLSCKKIRMLLTTELLVSKKMLGLFIPNRPRAGMDPFLC